MKNQFNLTLCVIAILAAIFSVLAACKQEAGATKPQSYAITIEYDSDTGTALASPNPAERGQSVTIIAQARENYKFRLWEVISGDLILTSNTVNPVIFTMPNGQLTIRAEFEILSDVTLAEIVYGYEQPAKRNILITNLGLDTQTVSRIEMGAGDESPFELDKTDINNKITVGNVTGFFIQPKTGLKAGSYSDTVNITHGGNKTTVLNITVTVTPKPVTVTGLAAQNKEYDGTTDAAITGTAVIQGLNEGDEVEVLEGTAVFKVQNVGEGIEVLLDGYTLIGADADNYELSPEQGLSADISPRLVTVFVIDPPANDLIPFGIEGVWQLGGSRKNTEVGLIVSGFVPGDTVTINVSENIYGLSGNADIGASGTLTVEYDGTEVEQTTAVQAELEAAGNYRLAELNTPLFNVRIRDGLEEARWLPVSADNISEFNAFAGTANGLNRHYRLVGNIALHVPQEGESNWTAIGTNANVFSGSFNGNNYVINNLTINNNSDNQGMFGVVGTTGLIRNAALVDSSVRGNDNIGGLAGSNRGTIENCYVTGTTSGNDNVGGLTGSNQGTIQNCYTVSNVSGARFIGGISGSVGIGGGSMRYCYATGKVVSTNGYAGGIAGFITAPGSLENCVALNSVIDGAIADTGRIVGYSFSFNLINYNHARFDMSIDKNEGEYAERINGFDIEYSQYSQTTWWTNSDNWQGEEWNFSTVWQMNGNNLPRLRSTGGSQNHEILIYIKMVQIPAGSFIMGSPSYENDRKPDEGPQQPILLSGFNIGAYELIWEQCNLILGTVDVYANNPKLPAELSWYEALVFCNRLSIVEGLSPAYSIDGSTDPADWGNLPTVANEVWNAVEIVTNSTGYRLPTEAQWEYACRAGTYTAYASGEEIDDDMCWYYVTTFRIGVQPPGTKMPNAWGLYDMHGNANEWCWDWYDSYTDNPQIDPTGPNTGTNRVYRGGEAASYAEDVRSAVRFQGMPYGNNGIRLVRP